jgi:hypothetical protein
MDVKALSPGIDTLQVYDLRLRGPSLRPQPRLQEGITLILIVLFAQAQDWAQTQLEKSPRHREWVTVK